MDGTVLVADDDRTIRTVLTQALTRAGARVHATSSLTTLMRWVSEGRGDVVISDVMMPDGNGLEMLPRISQERPDLPVIVISAQNTIMTAIRATEAEAFDYLPKPFDLPDLMKRTNRALETGRAARQSRVEEVPPRPEELPLVGRTPVMQALYQMLARLMNSDLSVLIRGETGAGKSLIARAIHDLSDRRAAPFVTIRPGDMSGPEAAQKALARARSGTLVVDRIEGLPEAEQAVILQLLDMRDGQGETAPRILSTLQGQDVSGLRDDLYFRLCGAIVEVPPLRDRVDDVALLAAHMLTRAEAEGLPQRSWSDAALEVLRRYGWPGNVRQLENVARHAALMSRETEISPQDIADVLGAQPEAGPGLGHGDADKLSDSVARHLRRYFDMHGGMLPPSGLYQRILRELELPLIEIALEASGGNQAKCAELLGINRNTLRKKITELDIRVTRRRKLM